MERMPHNSESYYAYLDSHWRHLARPIAQFDRLARKVKAIEEPEYSLEKDMHGNLICLDTGSSDLTDYIVNLPQSLQDIKHAVDRDRSIQNQSRGIYEISRLAAELVTRHQLDSRVTIDTSFTIGHHEIFDRCNIIDHTHFVLTKDAKDDYDLATLTNTFVTMQHHGDHLSAQRRTLQIHTILGEYGIRRTLETTAMLGRATARHAIELIGSNFHYAPMNSAESDFDADMQVPEIDDFRYFNELIVRSIDLTDT